MSVNIFFHTNKLIFITFIPHHCGDPGNMFYTLLYMFLASSGDENLDHKIGYQFLETRSSHKVSRLRCMEDVSWIPQFLPLKSSLFAWCKIMRRLLCFTNFVMNYRQPNGRVSLSSHSIMIPQSYSSQVSSFDKRSRNHLLYCIFHKLDFGWVRIILKYSNCRLLLSFRMIVVNICLVICYYALHEIWPFFREFGKHVIAPSYAFGILSFSQSIWDPS